MCIIVSGSGRVKGIYAGEESGHEGATETNAKSQGKKLCVFYIMNNRYIEICK